MEFARVLMELRWLSHRSIIPWLAQGRRLCELKHGYISKELWLQLYGMDKKTI